MEEVKLFDNEPSLQSIVARLEKLEKGSSGVKHAPQPLLANPSPLGLLGFAVVSWLAGLLKIIGHPKAGSDGLLAGTSIFLGGIAQIIAGLVQYPKNNTHSATVFCLFGGHWISQGFILTLREETYFPSKYTHESAAIYYSLLWVSTFILWIPTFQMNRVLNLTLFVVLFVFGFDVAAAFEIRWCQIAAGVTSCMAATLAFYMCTLDVVNESFGRLVFPVFPHILHRKDYEFGMLYTPRIHYHKSAMAGAQV